MDPNQTLNDLRAAIVAGMDDNESENVPQWAEDVLNLADALDTWLHNGGFLPRDWQN